MNNEKRLEKVIEKLWLVFIIIIFAELFFIIMLYIILNMAGKINSGIHADNFNKVKTILFSIYTVIIICVDLYFYFKKILGTKSIIGLPCLECTVQDYVIRKYKNESKIEYEVKLLVKCLKDGKYYFTYGKYSYCYFNNIYTLNNRKIRSIKVIREYKSVVEIGDKAYLYVKRNIYPNIKIMDKFVIIDYLKYSLMNKNLDINIFNKVIFFEGLIDVEK